MIVSIIGQYSLFYGARQFEKNDHSFKFFPLDLRTNVRFIHRWILEAMCLSLAPLKFLFTGGRTESKYFRNRSGNVADKICPNKAIVFQIPLLFLENLFPMPPNFSSHSQPEWDRQNINQFKLFIMDTKLLFNTSFLLYQLYHNFSFGFTADSTSRQNQNLEKLKTSSGLHQL